MLQLDRAAGGDHRRCEQRDDVPGAGRHGADRGGTAPGCRPAAAPAAGHGAGAGRSRPPLPRAADAQQLGDHPDRPERRHERRQLAADAADLGAELAGSLEQSRMWRRARPLVRTPRSWETIRSSRICAHAVSRASLAWASPTRALTSSDLTAGTDTASAPDDIGVGHAAELAHQQGRALLLGQALNVGDQAPQRVTLLDAGPPDHGAAGAAAASIASVATGCGRRSSSMQRLWAIRYSHARSASSRSLAAQPA